MTDNHHQDGLEAPTIKEANSENFLPFETLNQGITILIPWSSVFEKNDHLVINVGGITSFVLLDDDEPGKTIEHFIPGEQLNEQHGRRVMLNYIFVRNGITSPATDYDFGAELYHPVVEDVIDGVLPWCAVENGFSVTIPVYPGATPADIIRLFFVGSHPRASGIIEERFSDVGEPLEIAIGKALTFPTNGGEVHIIYQVIRDGEARTSPSVSFWSEAEVLAPNPTQISSEDAYSPAHMSAVESSPGKYAFTTALSAELIAGDEVFLLALNSASSKNEIAQKNIREQTNTVQHTLSKSNLDYMSSFKLVTLVRTQAVIRSSHTRSIILKNY
ncbi:hypothetical protein [Pseudomonas putida]|uniref:hypothetical protein n=1 Tax=Pseudomonas putida TaxID=303 RepID=UPI00276609C3|nr:hypothetical protein [Pseudomonas putida]MDP9524033.1 hypothetical protein [Pseudomonas putida]